MYVDIFIYLYKAAYTRNFIAELVIREKEKGENNTLMIPKYPKA